MLCVQMHYSNWNLRQREDVSFDLINFNLMYYIALHTGSEITTIQLMDMWVKFRIWHAHLKKTEIFNEIDVILIKEY